MVPWCAKKLLACLQHISQFFMSNDNNNVKDILCNFCIDNLTWVQWFKIWPSRPLFNKKIWLLLFTPLLLHTMG